MIRRAAFGPGRRSQDLLLVCSAGLAAVLLGCGGGGGGGGVVPPPGICGSAPGSTVAVLCGSVKRVGDLAAVGGATVKLLGAANNVLHTVLSNADGSFRVNGVSAGVVTFRVDPPATGYYSDTVRYGNPLATYAYYRNNLAGTGPCVMLTGAIPAGDKDLGSVLLYSDASAPPPPVFSCPK